MLLTSVKFFNQIPFLWHFVVDTVHLLCLSLFNPPFIPILCIALVAVRKLPLFHFSNIHSSPFATNSRDSSHTAPTHPMGVTVQANLHLNVSMVFLSPFLLQMF
jgi:hypothetical protein